MNEPSRLRPASWIAGFLLLSLGALYFYYLPLMPEVISDHFGGQGRPNGWHDQARHAVFYWGIIAVALFVGFLVPRLVRSIPAELVNLPHKEYWLTPTRRDEAFDALRDHMNWLGVAMLAMMLVIHREVFLANLRPDHRINNDVIWMTLAGFAIFMVSWLISIFRRFRVPAGENIVT